MALYYGSGGAATIVMEGPFGSVGTAIRLAELSLPEAAWKGAVSPYSQTVELPGLTIRSKVDLLPGWEQLEQFRQKELTFTTENCDGVLTVYAIGDRPDRDLVFQASVTEVTT